MARFRKVWRENNLSMIHTNICKLTEGNSVLVVVSIFSRKFLVRVLKINCFSIRPKESEIYEKSGRKPTKQASLTKLPFVENEFLVAELVLFFEKYLNGNIELLSRS